MCEVKGDLAIDFSLLSDFGLLGSPMERGPYYLDRQISY